MPCTLHPDGRQEQRRVLPTVPPPTIDTVPPLRALTHLTGLLGVREPRHQTKNCCLCAASAAMTRARARCQWRGPWQLKREEWHALHHDGSRERRTVLPPVPPRHCRSCSKKRMHTSVQKDLLLMG